MVKKTDPCETKYKQASAIIRMSKDPVIKDTDHPNIVIRAKQAVAGVNNTKPRKPIAKKSKSATPILDAMKRLEITQDGLKTTGIAQSIIAKPYIKEGELRYDTAVNGSGDQDSLYNFASATHFMCNEKLTELCVEGGDFDKTKHAHGKFHLSMKHGTFTNRLEADGLRYRRGDIEPIVYDTPKLRPTNNELSSSNAIELNITELNKILDFKGDF